MKIWQDKNKSFFEMQNPDSILAQPQDVKPVYIKKDLPIAVSIQGELVTIPESNIAQNICIAGMKQTLKSTMMYAICDREHWYRRKKCWLCNDVIGYLSYDHRFANNIPMFHKQLKITGEQKKGLPLVYLYPSTDTVRFYEVPNYVLYQLLVSIPFEEFIKNPERFEFVAGKLDKSRAAFSELKDYLLRCNTSGECLQVIDKIKAPGSKDKIRLILKKIFDEEIFDIDRKGISNITVRQLMNQGDKKIEKRVTADPISALMIAGLIPSMINVNLATKPYMKDVFGYFFRKVFEEKQEGVLKPYPVAIFCDEIHTILEKKNIEMVRRAVREGSNLENGGISFNYVAQKYSKVDPHIRDNVHYVVAARNKSTEAKIIADDFDLEKSYINTMKGLETFECLLLTKEKFKVYDPDRNDCYETNEPIRAKILFGLSKHRSGI